MESTDSQMLDTIIQLTWTCLEQPAKQNPLFSRVFPDLDTLEATARDANLQFCPGLLEAINGNEPPPISFFETLPPNTTKAEWGVYGLIMTSFQIEKGSLYIGEASEATRGVTSRFQFYDRMAKRFEGKTSLQIDDLQMPTGVPSKV
jgi:hypothetical protein